MNANADSSKKRGLDPNDIDYTKLFPQIPEGYKGHSPILALPESCIFKSTTAVVLGGVMGAAFGMFFGSMDTSYLMDEKMANASTKVQLKHSLKEMGKRSKSMAKNFAVFGGVFSGVECVVEKARGRHDVNNSLIAGCITGGGFAAKQGPGIMVMSCAGMAAFSYAFEHLLE